MMEMSSHFKKKVFLPVLREIPSSLRCITLLPSIILRFCFFMFLFNEKMVSLIYAKGKVTTNNTMIPKLIREKEARNTVTNRRKAKRKVMIHLIFDVT